MTELFDGLDEKPKFSIIRSHERKEVERDRDQSDIRYQSLAHHRPDRAMDPFELTIPARGGRREALPHEGEEFLVVLEGQIHFEFNGEMHEMAQGDAAYFDAEIAHRVLNPSDREARVLCVFFGRPLYGWFNLPQPDQPIKRDHALWKAYVVATGLLPPASIVDHRPRWFLGDCQFRAKVRTVSRDSNGVKRPDSASYSRVDFLIERIEGVPPCLQRRGER